MATIILEVAAGQPLFFVYLAHAGMQPLFGHDLLRYRPLNKQLGHCRTNMVVKVDLYGHYLAGGQADWRRTETWRTCPTFWILVRHRIVYPHLIEVVVQAIQWCGE